MTLYYSEYNCDNCDKSEINLDNNKNKSILKNHNKTAKKYNDINISQLYEKIHKTNKLENINNLSNPNENNVSNPNENNLSNQDENNFLNQNENNVSNMHDFKPIPMVKPNQYSSNLHKTDYIQEKIEDYNQIYYQSVPYKNVSLNKSNEELLQKLNYIINLLEEQRDEKTDNVMEEVILYIFLGIFVIFIIDSFARASKYVR